MEAIEEIEKEEELEIDDLDKASKLELPLYETDQTEKSSQPSRIA